MSQDYLIDLLIDGATAPAISGDTLPVVNPATGEIVGRVAKAGIADLDRALDAAQRAFLAWRDVPAFDRYHALRKAASLMRERAEEIARAITLEVGKPIVQSRGEVFFAADHIDWAAEEARRIYGRTIPPRARGVRQMVMRQPVGPVAAFTPWNFPVNQAVRKIAGAVAAGCSIIIKGPEEAPSSAMAAIRVFTDAGLPPGLVNLVFGVPAEISGYLLPHPIIQKVAFTGSTAVGKHLSSLAGQYMKRSSMELGGHAPAIVMADSDLDEAAKQLVGYKYRNAGQLCIAPQRILVEDAVYDRFVEDFVKRAQALKIGDGAREDTEMGPLCHARRVEAVEEFVADAVNRGAGIATGGKRIGNKGYFFEPTVLTDVPTGARVMNEEPFGPVAAINRFSELEEAIAEANRLRYGLASYLYTSSEKTSSIVGERLEVGNLTINHIVVAIAEVPLGGVKDSGYGIEGGSETLDAYLLTKFISHKTH